MGKMTRHLDLVSVIVPVHNGEDTLAEALHSVVAQTHRELEILVVDDGSTDGSVEVAQSIGDPRISVLRGESNRGVSHARNRGLEAAAGSYLAFLDSDDTWQPSKIEKQVAALERRPGAALAYCFVHHVRANGEILHGGIEQVIEGDVLEDLYMSFFLQCGSNALIRRQVYEQLGGFDTRFRSSEDFEFFLRVAAAYAFVAVGEHLVRYRMRPDSLSNSRFSELRSNHHRVLAEAVRRHPRRLAPLHRRAQAQIDGYIMGKVLGGPRDLRAFRLLALCLKSQVRAGFPSAGELVRDREKASFWGKKLMQWLNPRS